MVLRQEWHDSEYAHTAAAFRMKNTVPRPMWPHWPSALRNASTASKVRIAANTRPQVEEVPVRVVQDEREAALAGVVGTRLGDGARGGREPERAEVGLPVVVAGEPEDQRDPCGQQRRGDRPPRPDEGEVVRPGCAARGDAGREEDGDVRRGVVGLAAPAPEHAPDAVGDERGQQHHDDQRLDPPTVGPQGARSDGGAPRRVDTDSHQVASRDVGAVRRRGTVALGLVEVTGRVCLVLLYRTTVSGGAGRSLPLRGLRRKRDTAGRRTSHAV